MCVCVCVCVCVCMCVCVRACVCILKDSKIMYMYFGDLYQFVRLKGHVIHAS